MSKRISEIFDYGDEIVVSDEINGMFDPKEIKEITMEKIHAEHFSDRAGKSRRISRRVMSVAIAACLAIALAAVACAANFLGIRELWRAPNRELPEEAANLIEQREETAAATKGWSARVTESLCDASGAMVSLTVSGGDKYIVAPTDAAPEAPVSVIGLEGKETLADYAAAQGKPLLLVGANLSGIEDLGLFNKSQKFQNVSDRELAILIRAEKSVSVSSFDAVCTVYALEVGAEEVQRVEIPFTLTELPSEASEFTPIDPEAIPGLRVGVATVVTTPLGIDMSFPVNTDDEAAIYAIANVDCDEISDGSGGFVLDDGVWYLRWTMKQGSVGKTMTVHFYGQNGELLGDIIFKK